MSSGRAPDRLRIIDGELVMADGSDLKAYLLERTAAGPFGGPDEPVCIIPTWRLVELVEAEWAGQDARFALAS